MQHQNSTVHAMTLCLSVSPAQAKIEMYRTVKITEQYLYHFWQRNYPQFILHCVGAKK